MTTTASHDLEQSTLKSFVSSFGQLSYSVREVLADLVKRGVPVSNSVLRAEKYGGLINALPPVSQIEYFITHSSDSWSQVLQTTAPTLELLLSFCSEKAVSTEDIQCVINLNNQTGEPLISEAMLKDWLIQMRHLILLCLKYIKSRRNLNANNVAQSDYYNNIKVGETSMLYVSTAKLLQ